MSAAAPSLDTPHGLDLRRLLRALLPAFSLLLVLAAIGWLNPRAISYFGFTLMLNYAVPIALATMAQMFAMTGNDIDLSIGTFVGLLPKPGGHAPVWLTSLMGAKPPYVPLPILAALIIAAVCWFGLMRTSYGAILRGTGGNAVAIGRAGWSLLRAKVALFALVGLFGVLSGMALVGITRSADANIGNGYTLLSIAAVILGGGEFVGGLVSPIGAVIGALTLTLASTQLLGFMRIPPDWQVGANGAILVIVLAARVLISQKGRER